MRWNSCIVAFPGRLIDVVRVRLNGIILALDISTEIRNTHVLAQAAQACAVALCLRADVVEHTRIEHTT